MVSYLLRALLSFLDVFGLILSLLLEDILFFAVFLESFLILSRILSMWTSASSQALPWSRNSIIYSSSARTDMFLAISFINLKVVDLRKLSYLENILFLPSPDH